VIEKKVQTSTLTSAACGLLLYFLGQYVFKGDVPDVVVSWIYVLVPAALTFLAGYFTKHTPRPDVVVTPAVAQENVKIVPPAAQ
jgi:hypothetical protein